MTTNTSDLSGLHEVRTFEWMVLFTTDSFKGQELYVIKNHVPFFFLFFLTQSDSLLQDMSFSILSITTLYATS